ncbi:MAG: SDR family NAD(P)-dependent oxidoreductase [bacterium]|nr:SDR family NAD(P)-dependent oxidoreductase [bacterium]
MSCWPPTADLSRFGKQDIVNNSGLPMQTFNRNVSFAAVDVDRLLLERRDDARRILRASTQLMADGHFQPMPVTCFGAEKIADAFRYMAQSRHIGKVVLDMRERQVPVLESRRELAFRKDATYLITGGSGGLGREVVKWLASKGAGHIVAVSRNAAASQELQQLSVDLQGQASLHSFSADVGDDAQVHRLVEQIHGSMPPLRGIFHGAMVLDDGTLLNLNRERFAKVMRPKVRGALLLHKYTQELPLDYFVCFSSISSLIGNSGQGNYVAANAFLDAFAHYRRALGLPAVSINLGVLADVGVAARSTVLGEQFARPESGG